MMERPTNDDCNGVCRQLAAVTGEPAEEIHRRNCRRRTRPDDATLMHEIATVAGSGLGYQRPYR